MYMLLRQVFVAILGGVVAAGVMLVANNLNNLERAPSIALAQTSATISSTVSSTGNSTDSPDGDAVKAINYQGQVYNPNGGAPYRNQGLNFSFRLYNNPAGTNQVFREDRFVMTNDDGFFSTNIGDTGNFSNLYRIFNGQELYLGVYVNNQELSPLQPITFVPYAFWSVHAHHLDNWDAEDFPKIVAYGVVNDDGSRASGEHFSSSRGTVAGSTVYIINLDVNHSIFDYTTIVTPACVRPVMTGVGTSGDDLVVDVWDTTGARTQCRFEFMVLKK
jgi:hypothetical protein